jgi:glycosyltransferase involved in cell wall biosynthesis
MRFEVFALHTLFIHQNIPAQFRYLAPALAARGGNRVAFLTRRDDVDLPGVRRVTYGAPNPAGEATHHYVRRFEASVRYGQQVARALVDLKREGFKPAVIIGHPGWGEMLFVRDVFPHASVISYAEFYYRAGGADVGFNPGETVSLDTACRIRARNAHLLLSLDLADIGLAPTQWQRSLHPPAYQQRIATIFDGIDTALVCPDPAAVFTLPDGRTLSRADEVVTYVARNFEPYRGYPSFIRSVPDILRARPDARIVIVGGDDISYGKVPEDGRTWRETMNSEVPLDTPQYAERVFFCSRLPYRDYLKLLQISSAHIYLTIPFVLSWSCLEAMAAGCAMIASDTAPVREVITDGGNGRLVDFHDPAAIAAAVSAMLGNRAEAARLGAAARATVQERYDLHDCLARQLALVERAAVGDFSL